MKELKRVKSGEGHMRDCKTFDEELFYNKFL